MTLTALGMPALRSRTNGIADPRVVPTTGPLVDTFGRVANDLRVSLTDRCNLRCSYCMPERGLRWLPGEQLLRPDELARLIHIAVTRLGVTSVRFTGGEPLLAHHLDEVVAATARLRPRPEISLTTNGVGLARRAGALAEAGLDRVNVSLDSIDRAHFAAITRRDRLAHVLAGLAAAKAAGLTPVKVNAVLDPTTGREDVVDLLRFCLERGSAPAELWLVDAGPNTPRGRFGVIASVSHAFCSTCDRTRLTADGQIRSCLFSTEETDLRRLLRGGADDDAIEAAWRAAMWSKPAGHGINAPDFIQPDRPMSAIGG